MSLSALECDAETTIHQMRADLSQLQRKVCDGLTDDAEAMIYLIGDNLDALERCIEQLVEEAKVVKSAAA